MKYPTLIAVQRIQAVTVRTSTLQNRATGKFDKMAGASDWISVIPESLLIVLYLTINYPNILAIIAQQEQNRNKQGESSQSRTRSLNFIVSFVGLCVGQNQDIAETQSVN
jgi:hypothetical protein